jgi:hypothetical protein
MKLQLDRDQDRVWFVLENERGVPLHVNDREGLKAMTTWLVSGGIMSVTEAADIQGLVPRTVRKYQATYEQTANTAKLVDRRHNNQGQQTAYKMETHRGALLRQVTMNMLWGEVNSERRLAQQLGGVVANRTVGRQLEAIGWRGAEAEGLSEEVTAYLKSERQRAYWAGVAGEPLEKVDTIPKEEWETALTGQTAGIGLGTSHLVRNGAYESLEKLKGENEEDSDSQETGHRLLTYLLSSGGGRLSQAKEFAWSRVGGILGDKARVSASSLRKGIRMLAKRGKERVTVGRSDGEQASISRLRDYQEESVAQRVKRGLIKGEMLYLDDYVNTVYHQAPIARTKHGTRNMLVKAFRRHLLQDVETGHIVACPLGASDVTPQSVMEEAITVVNGGLERVQSGLRVKKMIADRWWSDKPTIRVVQQYGVGLLTWAKNHASVRQALSQISQEEMKQHPIADEEISMPSGKESTSSQSEGYRLDIKADNIYGLDAQAAFEKYCLFLNQQQVRVPIDGGSPWLFLFTYHKEPPPSRARFK